MPIEVNNIRNIAFRPSFNLTRPKLVADGRLSQPDPKVDTFVKVLDTLFDKKHFDKTNKIDVGGKDIELADFLNQDINDVTDALKATGSSKKLLKSFRDVVLGSGKTALLFSVQNKLKEQEPGFTSSYLLKHEGIFDFLFCTAVYAKEFEEADAIAQFMLETESGGGIQLLYDCIVKETVTSIVKDDLLRVTPTQRDAVIKKLQDQPISLAKGVFSERIHKELNTSVLDSDEMDIIASAETKLNLVFRAEEYPALINFIRSSNGTVNKQNAGYILPLALTQLRTNEFKVSSTSNTSLSDADFSVTYFEDDNAALVLNRENILCAAQNFYVMTLADEMELFNVANRIITKHFNSVGIKIPSKESHNMLKLYLFGDSFKDNKDGNIYKRTVPQERWLVYKGLFDAGDAQVLEGMTVNSEFNNHWEVLLTEVAKYLDKAERSENPEYFVSRQNIMQAIEDLQYNLSSYCTTMAKIAGPVINAELDFVMKEILQNPEITQRLARDGSNSVWKVVEHELAYMRQGSAPNVKALYDKARYGDAIIRAIANYSPALFEQTFPDFISLVEAYIIADSKLAMMTDERESFIPDEFEEITVPGSNGHYNGNGHGNYGRTAPHNGKTNGHMPADDWNF
ncbi:MAG: hypothetical protein IT270_05910 [Saprospiraceae bacterium]|nr:hypothetical protein [Saprospiraceae bacterium]